MEALQKLDVPNKINESLNINIESTPEPKVESNNMEIFKKGIIVLILLIFILFILRYVLNYTILGQNIKNSVMNFFYNIEIGGKAIFKEVNNVKDSKKRFIKESKNTIQELENAINKNIRGVSKKLRNKNLVTKQKLLKKNNKMKHSLKGKVNSPKRITKKELEADKSTNTIQTRSKMGFCYVGNDRGYRSCMEIDEMDKCMSNKIFPTRELCINPTLRV